MSSQRLTPEEIVERFRDAFGDGVLETRIGERREGSRKHAAMNIWIRLTPNLLKPGIQTLIDISYPHLAVIAGSDLGEEVELVYIFSLYYGVKHGEYLVSISIRLPKRDLRVPTISDLVPGAVFTEREKQEMLGVEVVGIPDPRRLFLPDEFPQGVYPWRKDEKGIPEPMVKELWKVKRPVGRPAPPVPPKPGKEVKGDA